MKSEIGRIYATAGQQVNFVSNNTDYWLSVNARAGDYRSFYRDLSANTVGVTGKAGGLVADQGRVFVDRLSTYAGTATSFAQNSNNLGIGLGRAGAHEIAHFLLQQASHTAMIQGVMSTSFSGAQWFSLTSQGLWTFNAYQIWRLNQFCKPITPENAPLNN